MRSNIFERLSFLSLCSLVVLLPLFCLPFTNIPVETSKGLLLVAGLALSIIFWAIARFQDGKIILPKSWLLVSGFGIVLVFLLSALFSKTPQVSLFGLMYDIGSFWFIFSAYLLMLMSSIVFRTSKRAKIVLFGVISSSALVLIFQIIHLFLPTVTKLGIFADKTGNVVGSWNSLGLFAGFSSLLFILILEFFPVTKLEKILLPIFILFSIFLIAAVNFPLIWILLGISCLIIFVYKVSINFPKREGEAENKNRIFPLISFIVAILCLLFFMSSGLFGNFIPNHLNVTNSEVSPSLSATVSVTRGVLAGHPFFGIGPNRFAEAWAMHKPALMNGTAFWDATFSSGSGLLPTLFSTTGYISILACLIFVILFIVGGGKSVFSSLSKGMNLEMMPFFVLSLYLFISSFFYSAGAVIFLLALVFAGVFIGLRAFQKGGGITISFYNDHRRSFFFILVLILIVVGSTALAFKYIERFISLSYFGKALTSTTIPEAEASISKALSLNVNDLYLRTYSQINLLKLDSLLKKGESLSDAEKAGLQTALTEAVNGAQLATTYNASNYLNFQALGSLYLNLGSLGVKDAYSKAADAYKTASILNPNNPGIKLSMAGVSSALLNAKDAKDYANAALALKPDYIDAYLVLAQLAKKEGDNTGAMTYSQMALSLAPTDPDLIKFVDSLKNPKNSGADQEVTPAPESIPKKP
ncbi:MAG TPA: hypothetical protein VK675_02800 [Candidatus Paceibacterota bacterium]|nr:hypothetical protein [Candidatus Paceibacterota bacterium]